MDPTLNIASQATGALSELLLRRENVYIMAAVWSLLEAVRRVLPPNLSDHHVSVRAAPLYPLALCSAAVWIPGMQPADLLAGEKIMVGLILGGACGYLHKVWKQSIRGKDTRIEAHKARKTSSEAPTNPGAKP